MLGWLNRVLGALFATLKWLLVMGLISIAFNEVNQALGLVKPEVIAGSHLYTFIVSFADLVFPYFKSLMTA